MKHEFRYSIAELCKFLSGVFWGWRNCCYIIVQESDFTKLTIN